MLAELKTFLSQVPEPILWVCAGFIAEAVLQLIRRKWNPPAWDYGKLKTLGAAALVSLVLACLSFAGSGPGAFVAHWLAVYMTAIGYHELKDKVRNPAGAAIADLLKQ